MEVHFETGFSLAVFSKTTKVKFAEQRPHSVSGVHTTVRSKGLIPQYRMCSSAEYSVFVQSEHCVPHTLALV